MKPSERAIAYWLRHPQPAIYYACPRNGTRNHLGESRLREQHIWDPEAGAFSCCWDARLADWLPRIDWTRVYDGRYSV